MTGLNTAAIYILQTLGSLYLLIVLLRFILQLVRADFYNPLSQFVVRATQPLVRPLRRLIPGLAGLDLASLILAIIVQLLLMALTLLLMGYGADIPGLAGQLLIWSIIGVTSLFIKVFFFALIGVTSGIGHFSTIKALEYAPASLLAPFAYVQLIWVAILGALAGADTAAGLRVSALCATALLAGAAIVVLLPLREKVARSAG